ncbi:class II aldolase and Adducin N-terminal domain-containing protein [Microdochium trichocladiopsis]|uniref:Class II aldolase and Adducin N-terminal domain-containing protein n=1 Tax=Microdochium trichocladiopsis TaxID=1682393 RepID=A0A9P8XZY4_9PEZI|nr:class II aldolase and Adducin N-terminal domain-containing protein [Microdochium trichocladiopsis]KAH7025140.1 class II aldolase and Adducin N-terminal domain-containing protein [Microdochium trichocladiopsis]
MPSPLSRLGLRWAQLFVAVLLLAHQCAAKDSLKLSEAKRKYITACHILDYHDIVDAFGHASIRNPDDNSTFIMERLIASALVADDRDLALYHISDGSPVRPQDVGMARGERFIHSEILKRFSGLNACVHAHTVAVLPYSTSDVPFLPVYHMVGYLGFDVPLWDIVPLYNATDIQDNLVSNTRFGASLAQAFDANGTFPGGNETFYGGNGTFPRHVLVLMKQHGFVTCAATIEEATYQAVYAKDAALVETGQLELRHAYHGTGVESSGGVNALSPKQVEGMRNFPARFRDTYWEYWVRQVEVEPLYQNNIERRFGGFYLADWP